MATITPLPPAPSRSDDSDTFAQKGDALLSALVNPFVGEANALITQADADSANATNQANIATAQATAAQLLIGATLWVSGTTYAVGNAVYSPLNYLTYRRKTSGAGTTDPSLDTTNWAAVLLSSNPVAAKSANYTIGIIDRNNILSCTGTFTLSCSASSTLTNGFLIYVNNDGSGNITITPNGSETINGVSGSYILGPNAYCKVYTDGNNLFVVVTPSKISNKIGSSIASASTVNLDTATGDTVHITGTTNITAITLSAGQRRTAVFDGNLTISNGSSLILPFGIDINTTVGQAITFVGEASNVVRVINTNSVPRPYMIVQDQKSGTAGGGSLTGSTNNIRTLNTVVANTINGASLASNQITLPAGTYSIDASCPVNTVDVHRAHLYNVTTSSVAVVGQTNYANSSNAVGNTSIIQGVFTISSSTVFSIRHYVSTGGGGGQSSNDGNIQVYTTVKIYKEI